MQLIGAIVENHLFLRRTERDEETRAEVVQIMMRTETKYALLTFKNIPSENFFVLPDKSVLLISTLRIPHGRHMVKLHFEAESKRLLYRIETIILYDPILNDVKVK